VTVHQLVRRNRVLRLVTLLAVALFAFGTAGAAGAAAASSNSTAQLPQRAVVKAAAPAAVVSTQGTGDCPYKYLCLWEGYNFTGKIHKFYYCETYYTNYPIHSVYNHQTSGTRASFRDYNNVQFYLSPAPNWSDGNTDDNGGSLNRAWYVKPC
jgi:hypothetical protein